MLHDPHTTPEPILVLSGLTYLIPAYKAYLLNKIDLSVACIMLTFTTVGFHGTRLETFFILDCAAILNFLVVLFNAALKSGNYALAMYGISVLYSLTSYFIGKRYLIMSFDPNWNTQMAYHACMHLSSAYAAYATL